MIPYRVRHETVYSYSNDVAISHNIAHLLPRPCGTQSLFDLKLTIEPTPSTVRWFDDYFGNSAVFFIVTEPHERLRVLAESRVEIEPLIPVDVEDSPGWEEARETLRAALDTRTMAAYEFVCDSPFVETSGDLADYARTSFTPGRPLLAAASDLCRRIHVDFRYDPEATTLATPLREVLEERHGVCQDFAHLMIGAMRSLGLAARYVSGYIQSSPSTTTDDPGPSETQEMGTPGDPPQLVGSEASHAWVSVFCPRAGWIDFDPTNNMMPSDRHVVLAWGRDYDDVSPLQGVTLGGGLQTVSVGVSMQPYEEVAS